VGTVLGPAQSHRRRGAQRDGPAVQRVKIVSAVAVLGLLAGAGTGYLWRPVHVTASPATLGSTAAPGSTAMPASTAQPGVAVTGAATERFEDWINGTGGTLLENSIGVLAVARTDAASGDYARLGSDGSSLIASGSAALADPPPSHAASWNAAFAAMVLTGQDLEARNASGASAESKILQADIYRFNSQMSSGE
jgi:hypothetical protein